MDKTINVRLKDDLWRRVKAEAALRGQTLSELLAEILEKYLKERK